MMKKLTGILVAALSVLVVSCAPAKKAGSASNEETAAFISNAVSGKDFRIDVSTAYAFGRMYILSSPYAVTVKGDSVSSYLPYYGQAYQVTPYGGNPGLNFNGTMTDYKIGKGKRGSTVVRFALASREDRYQYTIEIAPDGTVNLTVDALNRESIDFTGALNRKAEKE